MTKKELCQQILLLASIAGEELTDGEILDDILDLIMEEQDV
jgi:hypothetical protein